MATQHDKMQQDYVWIREHSDADSWGKARTFGQNYLYYHAPNKRERLEMIWRSIGKSYDWELEKFRMSKKFPDRGNKRRFFKNVFRFVKNPTGYAFWKTYKLRQSKGRFITTCLGVMFLGMLWQYKVASYASAKKSYYILKSGKNVEGNGHVLTGYGNEKFRYLIYQFYDRLARQSMPLTQMLYQDLHPYSIVVSPSRDQNYRKYFEMRKKYGIKEDS